MLLQDCFPLRKCPIIGLANVPFFLLCCVFLIVLFAIVVDVGKVNFSVRTEFVHVRIVFVWIILFFCIYLVPGILICNFVSDVQLIGGVVPGFLKIGGIDLGNS